MEYLILLGTVFIVGVIPAFGPPSLVFAIYFYQKYHLSFLVVVLITAFATTLGRISLAMLTRKFKARIPKKYIKHLEYSKKLILKRLNTTKLGVSLFLLSPLPSAQLFEAVGLLNFKVLPLGLAFFVGRIISLSLYLTFSRIVASSFNQLWESGFSSWWAIIFELIAILLLIAMFRMQDIVQVVRKRWRKESK